MANYEEERVWKEATVV